MPHKLINDIQLSFKKSILKDVSGWIFTNFHHRDTLTDFLLKIDSESVSTRRWIYIVKDFGNPIKILHKIEKEALSHLPGDEYFYSSQEELVEILSLHCKNKTYAILKDKNIPVISTVDGGFVELLAENQIKTVSAATLVQLTKSILSKEQIESQKKAGKILYDTIFKTWEMITFHYKNNLPLFEKDVQDFILESFEKNHIITDHPPIVAFGKNSGNPHYDVSSVNNSQCQKGNVIQLDIWGKLANVENSVYADISWVGIYDSKIPEKVEKCFECLKSARDVVISSINEKQQDSFQPNEDFNITGSFLDKKVRDILIKNGYEAGIKHRTGHSIDTECHGTGVNLDSIEFPDNRLITEGCSFSVEPGLYFEDFGLRTEIDVTIFENKAFIPGADTKTPEGITIPQNKLLTC